MGFHSKKLLSGLLLVLLSTLIAPTVAAHEIGYAAINTGLEASGEVVRFTTEVPLALTFETEAEEERHAIIADYYTHAFYLVQDGQNCPVEIGGIQVFTEEEKTRIEGAFKCTSEVASLDGLAITNYVFSEFFNPYDHFVSFKSGSTSEEIIFTQDKRNYPFEEGVSTGEIREDEPGNFFEVVKRFVVIGVEHIVFGFDHLLFLLATVLVMLSFRRVFVLVTSFTVAHSVTLIAASMGWIIVSSKFVEPIIALSIAVIAIRNMWILHFGKDTLLKERWLIVFLFGLIHGLGFAGALSEISIPDQYFLPALLSFNLGVEVGQLMALAVVIPYLLLLRGHKVRKKVLFGVSGLIALISLFWFVERIFS